jgi:uncharacterized protein
LIWFENSAHSPMYEEANKWVKDWKLVIILLVLFLLLALIVTPKEVFKGQKVIRSTVIFLIATLYILIFQLQFPVFQPINRFSIFDFIPIAFLVIYATFRFLNSSIVNRIFYISEFDVKYLISVLLVMAYYLVLRKINISPKEICFNSLVATLFISFTSALILTYLGIRIKFLTLKKAKVDLKIFFSATVYMFLFVALLEEIIFRGLLFTYLKQFIPLYPIPIALAISSFVFGWAHQRYGLKMVLLSIVAGLFYGTVYILTNNIFLAALSHTLINIYRRFFLTTVT